MQRLRGLKQEAPPPAEDPRAKNRADVLSQSADAAKRGADNYIEQEQAKGRSIAVTTAIGGVLSMVLGGLTALDVGNPHVMSVLAALAALCPTALVLSRAMEGDNRVRDAIIDRGVCQALAIYARRLGDSFGATDEHNLPLSADALLNGQLDGLFKDLERAKQRLSALGASVGSKASVQRSQDKMVPDRAETTVVTSDGRRYPVWITELTLSGVTVRGLLPPLAPVDVVQIGTRRARINAVSGPRASFTFLTPIVSSEYGRHIVL